VFAISIRKPIILLACMFAVVVAPAVLAAPGDFDNAFGPGGKAIVSIGRAHHVPTAIATQADGKYYVSFAVVDSTGPYGGIARFNKDHTRDNTWGYQGVTGSSEKYTVSDIRPDGIGDEVSGIAVSGSLVLAVENGGLGNGGNGSGQYPLTRVSRYTSLGELDRTFGYEGQTIPFAAGGGDYWQRYNAITIAPDGKIVVVGEASGALMVARYFASGSLDTSFGSGGWTRLTAGAGFNAAYSVVAQLDGKIVVAGTSGAMTPPGSPGNPDGVVPIGFVLRLNDSGALDSTFNSGGVFQLPVTLGSTDCRSVVLDGARIVVGCTQTNSGVKNFLLLGLTTSGAIDTGFVSTPKYSGGTNDALLGMSRHPDGRFFAVGRGGVTGNRIVVLAANADGSPNLGFANGGVYVVPETEASEARAIGWNGSELIVAGSRTVTSDDDAVVLSLSASGVRTSQTYSTLGFSSGSYLRVKALPNGQMVAAGVTDLGMQRNFLISRFNANGTLDKLFGASGHTTVFTGSDFVGVRDFVSQADGKTVLTGQFGSYYNSPTLDVGAVRLLGTGQIDNSFNAAVKPGLAILQIPNVSNVGRGRAVRVQADGKILVLARSSNNIGSGVDNPGLNLALVRFNVDGTVDSSYGVNGLVSSNSLGSGQYMELDAAGRALVALGNGRLLRFIAGGVPDTTFGVDGTATYDFPSGITPSFVNKLLLLPSGKILVVMNARLARDELTGLARVNADGTLDTAFGTGGFTFAVTSPGIDATNQVLDAVVLPNGRVALLTGVTSALFERSSAVVRFLPNGALDNSFGVGGVRNYPASDGSFLGVEALKDGSMLLSGALQKGGNNYGLIVKTVADVTATSLVARAGDFDADGKSDLLFRNAATGQISAWLMNGAASTATAGLVPPGNWTVTHTADFNGDGKADILYRNDDGSVTLWLMNGLTLAGSVGLLGPNPDWRVSHVADFNGDGKADILWRNTNGAVTLWLMDGTTVTSSIGLLGADPGWSVSHVADFNGDGKADLLWRNTNGAVTLWLMNGTAIASTAGLLGADANWRISHVADFDGDGKADLLWRNTNGAVTAWLMNGTATASTAGLLGADANWSVSHTGDFNGDGKADLLWRNTNGAVTQWLMNGTGILSTAGLLGADANWRVTHIGDYNGDGKADLVWRNIGNGAITMWLMNGAVTLSAAGILGATTWGVTP
jgi:uncharacterized delta-60 repeat protein